MSQYSIKYLNENTLYGYTDKRRKAWHFSERFQGDESTHYPGAIPVEDVRRRLLDWEPIKMPAPVPVLRPDGTASGAYRDSTHEAVILHSKTGRDLGYVGSDFAVHSYDEWLLQHVSELMDTGTRDLGIASVVMLKHGALCAVSFEVADNFTTQNGVQFRPWLMAATALDGSLATTYKRHMQALECDNTFAGIMRERGQEFKVRHTSKSDEVFKAGMPEARKQLELTFQDADDFAKAVDELVETTVTPKQTDRFLELFIPVPEATDDNSRAVAMRQNKQNQYRSLLEKDHRVAPWSGTAWGLVQMVNTYENHLRALKGNSVRVERDTLRVLRNTMDREDRRALKVLEEVMAA